MCIVIFQNHLFIIQMIHNQLNFSIIISNYNYLNSFLLLKKKVVNMNILVNWNGFNRPNLIHLTQIHESIELALGSYKELFNSILVYEWHNCSNWFWRPVFFRFIFFWGKFSSKSHSSFFLFFCLIFFLIFLHLKLHNFDFPCFNIWVFPKI